MVICLFFGEMKGTNIDIQGEYLKRIPKVREIPEPMSLDKKDTICLIFRQIKV